MERIRIRLLDETAGIKKSENKRKEREGKKFGKQVQVEKIKEREKSKKEMEERLKGLKRSTFLQNPSIEENPMFYLQRERTSWITPKPPVVEMTLIFRSKTLSRIVLPNGDAHRAAEEFPATLATRNMGLVVLHGIQNLIPGNPLTTLALELAEEEVAEVLGVEEGADEVEAEDEVGEEEAEVAVLDRREEVPEGDAVALKDWENQDGRISLLLFTLPVFHFTVNTITGTQHPGLSKEYKNISL